MPSFRENGLSNIERERIWKSTHNRIFSAKENLIGYQTSQNVSSLNVQEYLGVHINNVGDPFTSGTYASNSKVMECAILNYFAKLWNINQWNTNSCTNDHEQNRGYWGLYCINGFYGSQRVCNVQCQRLFVWAAALFLNRIITQIFLIYRRRITQLPTLKTVSTQSCFTLKKHIIVLSRPHTY